MNRHVLGLIFKIFMMLGCTAIFSHCKSRPQSDLKIFEGEECHSPGVVHVQAVGNCTGTFVSKTTMFTAAHCVMSNTIGVPTHINGKIKTAQKIFTHGIEGDEVVQYVLQVGQKDFAIVVFDEPVSEETVPIGFNAAKAGLDARIAGFGATDPSGGIGLGTERGADVKIDRMVLGQSIYVQGKKNINHGDSGGPILIDGKIVGVASFNDEKAEPRVGVFTNISHPENLELMRKAVKEGAIIPGIPAADTTSAEVKGKEYLGGMYCSSSTLDVCPVTLKFASNGTATMDVDIPDKPRHVVLKYKQAGKTVKTSSNGNFSQETFDFTVYASGKLLYDSNGVQYVLKGAGDPTDNPAPSGSFSLIGKKYKSTGSGEPNRLKFVDQQKVTDTDEFGTRNHKYTVSGDKLSILDWNEPGHTMKLLIQNGGKKLGHVNELLDYECENCGN